MRMSLRTASTQEPGTRTEALARRRVVNILVCADSPTSYRRVQWPRPTVAEQRRFGRGPAGASGGTGGQGGCRREGGNRRNEGEPTPSTLHATSASFDLSTPASPTAPSADEIKTLQRLHASALSLQIQTIERMRECPVRWELYVGSVMRVVGLIPPSVSRGRAH